MMPGSPDSAGNQSRSGTAMIRVCGRQRVGSCGMLEIGGRAPEFTLLDHTGQPVSLSTLLRSGPLILYFYPADFTPGCTREACSIRDLHTAIQTAGLDVAGVSPQDPESHRLFREKYQLPFTLLADTEKVVIK